MKEYHLKDEKEWNEIKGKIVSGDIIVADETFKPWDATAPFMKGIKYEWGETLYGPPPLPGTFEKP